MTTLPYRVLQYHMVRDIRFCAVTVIMYLVCIVDNYATYTMYIKADRRAGR